MKQATDVAEKFVVSQKINVTAIMGTIYLYMMSLIWTHLTIKNVRILQSFMRTQHRVIKISTWICWIFLKPSLGGMRRLCLKKKLNWCKNSFSYWPSRRWNPGPPKWHMAHHENMESPSLRARNTDEIDFYIDPAKDRCRGRSSTAWGIQA